MIRFGYLEEIVYKLSINKKLNRRKKFINITYKIMNRITIKQLFKNLPENKYLNKQVTNFVGFYNFILSLFNF